MIATSQVKTALITGGNRGIGFAITQGLLSANWHVIIGSRSLEKGNAAAQKLRNNNVSVVSIDVSSDESIEKAVQSVGSKVPQLDVLINNAGIFPDENVDILTIKRNLLMQTLNTNTFGQICAVQAFLPLLKKAAKEAGGARIINYSSGYGQLAGLSANAPSYCLSKLAVDGATIMLSEALRSTNITVNAVDPGWVSTDMGGKSAPRTPQQGADTAVWLATQEILRESGKLWHERRIVSF